MDVFTTKRHISFVWDSEKAATNFAKHGVSFDRACEVFFDPLVKYVDSSIDEESRTAAVGKNFERKLLFVIHVDQEPESLRIISARHATATERRSHEDHE